ncbi:fascin-like [Saccoglossus kowalevskii]|uniref:Fascin n=1 Tax=Saccoglossus kowalevskii TaxID=10224 RepID=A0ABM0GYR2_SACKO|nr:PREDICTED: fascin-like [Saccoglossus kowalevskii]
MSSNGVIATERNLVFGFMNSSKKYLTHEKFGLKINALGKFLKSKQKWTVEQPAGNDAVFLRSHLNRYMSADEKGNVSCEAEAKGDNEKFVLEIDNDGLWALKSYCHGYYFGGTDDTLSCFSKTKGANELWTVHVAIHPQVHIRNVKAKRYAKMEENELRVIGDLPWGEESLVTLAFRDGKYMFLSFDDKYLHRNGSMVDEPSDDTKFVMELHSGKVSFKDCEGCYLSCIGQKATMKSKNKSAGKDELFVLEDSYPQGVIIASSGKYVSLKQGQDLSANQDSIGAEETFQLEFDEFTGKWAFRISADKYWTLASTSGIQATSTNKNSPEALFQVEYHGKHIALKAKNGKYVTCKPSGHLYASADVATDKEMFLFRLINRPLLVLRGVDGFVGVKSSSKSNKLECNCSKYTLMHLLYNDGRYKLKTSGDKSWAVDSHGDVSIDGANSGDFILEFHRENKLCIRAPNDKYIKGEQSGIFRANGSEVNESTMWEY